MEMDRKKLIAIAAIVVAVIVVAGAWIGAKPSDQDDLRKQQAAGGRPDPSQMRKQMVERMATDLSLTADQRTKLEAIQAAAEPKMRAMFQSPPQSGSQTDRMAKMQALMKEQQAQISAILTPEQRMKFESMQARMPQGGPGGGGPGMGGPGMGGPGMGGPPPGMVGAGMGGPPPGMNGGSNNN